MISPYSLQQSCMASIKNSLGNISKTRPTVGRLCALPVATIDVMGSLLATQATCIQQLALSVFKLVKSAFAKDKLNTLRQSRDHFISAVGLNLLIPLFALLAPVATFHQAYKVIQDPVKNANFKSAFTI